MNQRSTEILMHELHEKELPAMLDISLILVGLT